MVKEYYAEKKHIKLKKLLAGAHKKLPGFDFGLETDAINLKKGILKFQISKYQPMRVEYLSYVIRPLVGAIPKQAQKSINLNEDNRWYVTQGIKKDCMYYLTLIDASAMEFNIDRHICGIKIKF